MEKVILLVLVTVAAAVPVLHNLEAEHHSHELSLTRECPDSYYFEKGIRRSCDPLLLTHSNKLRNKRSANYLDKDRLYFDNQEYQFDNFDKPYIPGFLYDFRPYGSEYIPIFEQNGGTYDEGKYEKNSDENHPSDASKVDNADSTEKKYTINDPWFWVPNMFEKKDTTLEEFLIGI